MAVYIFKYTRIDCVLQFNNLIDRMRTIVYLPVLIAFWYIFPAFYSPLMYFDDCGFAGKTLLAVLSLLLSITIYFPFYNKKFYSSEFYRYSPFVIIAIYYTVTEFFKNPIENLFRPYSVVNGYTFSFANDHLLGQLDLCSAMNFETKYMSMKLIAFIFFVIGYIAINRSVFFKFSYRYAVTCIKSLIIYGVSFLLFMIMLSGKGGLVAHFAALAFGRANALAESGHFVVVIKFVPIFSVLSYFLTKKKIFIFLFVLSLFMVFVATGSRSSIFVPLLLFLCVWVYFGNTVHKAIYIVLPFVVVLSIGVLGDLRADRISDSNDFPSFNELYMSTEGALNGNKQVSGDLAIIRYMDNDDAYLNGLSYISLIGLPIPRTIWEDKPRGIGAHVGAIIYSGYLDTKGYDGTAYPPGGIAESYWNFGYIGLCIVFLLYGILTKLMYNLLVNNKNFPIFVVIYFYYFFQFSTPATDDIVPFVQTVLLCTVVHYIFKAKYKL